MKMIIVVVASVIAGGLFGAAFIFWTTGSMDNASTGALIGVICVGVGLLAAWKLEEWER